MLQRGGSVRVGGHVHGKAAEQRGARLWYLESETSLSIADSDAHDDDPRDGYLNLFFDAGSNRQNVMAYLVSTP